MNIPISLCMIVRDEADHLSRCLNSVKGVIDEIIVVDTGSIDDTVSIAASYGAQVFQEKWNDDFSAPRNTSIEKANNDWILVLDGDEQLAEESKSEIKEIIKNPNALGYRIQIQLHPEWTAMNSVRLFRNNPTLRFQGIFHETLTISKVDRMHFKESDICILHKPFSESISKAKRPRNMRLLKKHLETYPSDVYQMLDLMRLHLDNDELKEAEHLSHRIDSLLYQSRCDGLYKLYKSNHYKYKLNLLSKKGEDLNAQIRLCKEAGTAFPNSPVFPYEMAQIYCKMKDYTKSKVCFQRCLDLGEYDKIDSVIMFPKDILGAKSLAGLGYCSFKQLHFNKAIEYLEKSYSLKQEGKVADMLSGLKGVAQKITYPRCQEGRT